VQQSEPGLVPGSARPLAVPSASSATREAHLMRRSCCSSNTTSCMGSAWPPAATLRPASPRLRAPRPIPAICRLIITIRRRMRLLAHPIPARHSRRRATESVASLERLVPREKYPDSSSYLCSTSVREAGSSADFLMSVRKELHASTRRLARSPGPIGMPDRNTRQVARVTIGVVHDSHGESGLARTGHEPGRIRRRLRASRACGELLVRIRFPPAENLRRRKCR